MSPQGANSQPPTEYVQRFGYRKYTGGTDPRWMRIARLAWFEVTSTWRKSSFGKIVIVVIFVINFFTIFALAAIIRVFSGERDPVENTALLRMEISNLVSYYLSISSEGLRPAGLIRFTIMMNIGFLLIPLLGIAGSGLFADDKQGHLIEIYLAKLRRIEYAAGKVGAAVL